MKKYLFQTQTSFFEHLNSFRCKNDMIFVLLECIKYITATSLTTLLAREPRDMTLGLCVSKMSRFFIGVDQKIHSFQFPFSVTQEQDLLRVWYNDYELNNKVVAVLLSLVEQEAIYRKSIDYALDIFTDVMRDYGVGDVESSLYWELLLFLLDFEPGYLRFDFDDIRKNGRLHPTNHLDVNYSNKGTYKIGLESEINFDELIDILDINTECRFFEKI